MPTGAAVCLPSDMTAPLAGLKVIDAATLFAGPIAATMLGDYGADVVKIEHPRLGDPTRTHGHSKNGVGLWWKLLGRNKRTITLDLGTPDGAQLLRRLVADADVLVENFRPGTLERWGIGPDVLLADNPRLVVARVSGFGQFGPMAQRPGFGTLAESMSGFAHLNGDPDGPPTLPPLGLADNIAGITTAFAIMTALRARDDTGRGQVIDLAIIEPIMTVLGPQPTVYEQLGVVPTRTGNRSEANAPRNAYLTRDGRWLAVSASSTSIASRILTLVGRPDLVDEPWFASSTDRARHADVIDEAVAAWIAQRDADDVLTAFEHAHAAIAPIYDAADVVADPQYAALGSLVELDDPELGPLRVQNVMFRMSDTPGAVRWAGRPMGADNDEVFGALGMDAAARADLASRGVI